MATSAAPAWHEPLNERENQILGLIAEGYSNREIAHKLSLSLDTIKWYNKQLYSKLGVSSRGQATATARSFGLLGAGPVPGKEEQTSPKHNLPQIPTSFIGRQNELEEIKHLLQHARLVVLTGAGGSGKTRLAIQVASQLVDKFPDGVWLVELAPLNDPRQVPHAISDVLGVSQRGETALMAKIQHILKPKHLLLVLDNFEHLLSASSFVGELIASCPQITILATSRERLHVYGEQEVPVHPLALPDPEQAASPEQLVQTEAASLFLDRAMAVRQDFKLQPGEHAALAHLCIKLDGLPLALELAASWIKVFSLPDLVERLDDRFSLLTGGARNLPERQRTLRETINWSYNLLDEAERLLFARLAVFRGGGALEAVERICGHDFPQDILPVLSSLVDKSLVRTGVGSDGERRFWMLETIREYATDLCFVQGEADEINFHHAAYYASLAETAARNLRLHDQRHWFARVHSEYDNLHTALTWSFNSDTIEPGLRITAALRDYWYYTGILTEYQFWTDLALERMQDAAPELQAGVLLSAGQLGVMKGPDQKRIEYFNRAIQLYTQLGDDRNIAWAEMFLSAQLNNQPLEHDWGIALCQRSLKTFRRTHDLIGQAQALNILGEYARVRLELEKAKDYYEQGLELVAQTGERLREGMLHVNLGFIAYRQGEYRKALQLMLVFIHIQQEFANDYGLMTGIASISGPLAALGHPDLAARLLAATEAQMEMMGSRHQATDILEIDTYQRAIHEALGEQAFQEAWEEGSRMTIQQMLALANDEDLML